MSQSHSVRAEVGAGAGVQAECKWSLLSVIDSRIVPQLMRDSAHTGTGPGPEGLHFTPDDSQIAEFARLCFQEDERSGRQYLDRLLEKEYALSEVLLNLVGPAARWLGDQWDQDQIGFSEVTLGLVRMQNVTHDFAASDRHPQRHAPDRFRMLVASAPGSQHLLGLTMVSELFASDGWEVRVEVASTQAELFAAVQAGWFDVLGLSVGLAEQLPGLADLVAQLRSHSRNPCIAVLLGGIALTAADTATPGFGADAICLDPVAAIRVARRLAMRTPPLA